MRLPAIAVTSLALLMTAGVPAVQAREANHWRDQGIRNGVRGADVSLWQHGYSPPLSFSKLRASGIRFVFIKGSDGSPRADAQARYWWSIDSAAALRAKVIVGAYHYAQPTQSSTGLIADARAEARLAANRAMPFRTGQLASALDLEWAPKKLSRSQLTKWAVTWLRTYTALTGRRPYLYSYRNFLETRLIPTPRLVQFPVWLAHYGRAQGPRPKPIRGWPAHAPLFWQFTSSGRIPGSGSRNLDLNLYLGSRARLRFLARLGPSAARSFGI